MLLVDRSLLAATRQKGQRAAVSTGRRRRSRRDGNVPFVMWQLIWRPLTRWACEMCSVVARLGGAFLLAPSVWVCVCVRAHAFPSSRCTVYLPSKSQLFCSSEREAVFPAPCHSLSTINSMQSLCIFLQIFSLPSTNPGSARRRQVGKVRFCVPKNLWPVSLHICLLLLTGRQTGRRRKGVRRRGWIQNACNWVLFHSQTNTAKNGLRLL